MIRSACLLLFLFISLRCNAQELFPLSEPASNVPKGALGVRLFGEGYKEQNVFRKVTGLRVMYGVTPRLSVYVTGTASDYHPRSLPFDFIDHSHIGGQLTGGANSPQQGARYPMVLNSAHLYAKYRFLSRDEPNKHYRMAGYAEGSYVAVPSHAAEPNLPVHTSGIGAGIINTYLSHHFAASLTTGVILPSAYSGNATDRYGGIYPTTIQYGSALNYNLSFGYLLFPRNYKSYRQANWSLYLEFVGRTYGAASVSQRDGPAADALPIPVSSGIPILQAGTYVDVNPGIQCVINSTYRIEASAAFAMVGRSYLHQYPLYMLGVQRYFYFNRKKAGK